MISYWQDDVLPIVWALNESQTPEPTWTATTEAAYDANVLARQAAIDAATAASEGAACADKLQAYNELKASAHTADWPEHLFVFLTGSDGSPC